MDSLDVLVLIESMFSSWKGPCTHLTSLTRKLRPRLTCQGHWFGSRTQTVNPKSRFLIQNFILGEIFIDEKKLEVKRPVFCSLPRLNNLLWLLTTRNCCDNLNNNYCYKGHHFLSTHSVLYHSQGFTCITYPFCTSSEVDLKHKFKS